MLRASLAAALAAAFIVFAFPNSLSAQPSFDCRKASSSVEITICNSRTLANLDSQMAALYEAARNASYIDSKELLASQRRWWRQRDSQCGRSRRAVECLEDMYNDRIGELNSMLY
ncbi:MAG: lysozyme inhibitor LprI family protein [Deltaproteobacteria bacterium]|jgi:uncharacterized protein|nr:lysozyme inhibitor LprI family protein [Deltaproteobacteria bacterium]